MNIELLKIKLKNKIRFFLKLFLKGQSNKKIFCIGFNKTGTTSLHHFFEDCGLNSLHHYRWPFLTKQKKIDKTAFLFDAYSDGEQSNFRNLEEVFPGSLFIFNYRDEKKWLYSRVKHAFEIKAYAPVSHEFFADPELAIKKWICDFRLYLTQARLFFKGKSNYIEIDVTEKEDWPKILVDFFNQHKLNYNKKFKIKKDYYFNKRPASSVQKTELLAKNKLLIEKVLKEMGSFNL